MSRCANGYRIVNLYFYLLIKKENKENVDYCYFYVHCPVLLTSLLFCCYSVVCYVLYNSTTVEMSLWLYYVFILDF